MEQGTEESIQLQPPRNTPNFTMSQTPSPLKAYRAAAAEVEAFGEEPIRVPQHTPFTGQRLTEYTAEDINRKSITHSFTATE